MSENVMPYLVSNLIPILLTLIVVVILLVIIDKLFAPFRGIKKRIQNFNEKIKTKKIETLENEVKNWEIKYQENKIIISKMKSQLTELSGIFGTISELETEYTKNINDLEQKKEKFIDIENQSNFFLIVLKPIQKRRIAKQINKLGEKIKLNEDELNVKKESIKNKITEMLGLFNNLSN